MIYDIDEERFERGLRDFENAIAKCCAKHNVEWTANISGASGETSVEATAYATKGQLAAEAAKNAQAWLDKEETSRSHSTIGFGHASNVIGLASQTKDA